MPPNKIPVIVLTGFLGSGKTTLLNRFIADGPKTAVIINEFGSTPVDQQLIEQQGMSLTTLAGGCLCCQIKGTLAPTLRNLWMAWNQTETRPFARMIIETSGVASPEPILDTLLRDRWLSSRYQLLQVITTLAIPSAIDQLTQFAEARAQVAWADTLLLTHADLADERQTNSLVATLQKLTPTTPQHSIITVLYDTADIADSSRTFRKLPLTQVPIVHGFASISVHLQTPLAWSQLQGNLQKLLQLHAPDLLRIKGVVYFDTQPEAWVIQATGDRLYPPTLLPSRSTDDQRGRLVFITRADVNKLADDVQHAFGNDIDKNAMRMH